MKHILALAMALTLMGARADVKTDAVAAAYNRFGLELLAQTRHAVQSKNYFLSPAGLAFALAMVENGAKGETLRQFAATLQGNGISLDDLNAANKALLDLLTSSDPKLKLEIANGMWTDKNALLEPEFVAANKSFYNAQVFNADFQDRDTVKTINDWVSAQTDGKITQMVQAPLDPMLRLIVLDAVYFKGQWANPFDPKQTKELPFTLAGGDVVKNSRMVKSGKFRYFENDDFQAVDLPYAGEGFSMEVFLPKKTLDDLFKNFTAEQFQQWTKQMELRGGILELPKFKLQNEYELKPVLSVMGMQQAFTPEADFRGISKERIYISRIEQKTYVDVNEEGTEAAAVTGIFATRSAAVAELRPFYMDVNHPFLMAIYERKTGLILFLGAIMDPR
jgi:serpin B